MKNLSIAVIYIAFFALIGIACYITQTAIPLLALFLTPSYKSTYGDDSDDSDDDSK